MNRRDFLSVFPAITAGFVTATLPAQGKNTEAFSVIKGTEFQGHKTGIRHIEFSHDGETLFTTTHNEFAVWSAKTGERLSLHDDFNPDVICIDSKRGRVARLNSLGQDNNFLDIEKKTTQPIVYTDAEGEEHQVQLTYTATYHSEADLFAFKQRGSFNQGDFLVLIDGETLKTIGFRDLPGSSYSNDLVSANLRRAIHYTADGGVRGYDLREKRPLPELFGHRGGVDYIHISHDGSRAVSSSSSEGFAMWNLDDGSEIIRRPPLDGLRNHYGGGTSSHRISAVSPNFKYILTGDENQYVYDLVSDEIKAELPGLKDYVSSAAFSPDGKSVAAGDADGRLIIWKLPED